MSVSNYNYGTALLTPAISTLPQCKESNRENPIDGQNLFFQDSKETHRRVGAFFKYLERALDLQEGNKSPLQNLLKQAMQLSSSVDNSPVFAEMTKAFFKQKGYLLRLFSGESWTKWTENRTSFGKVAAQFKDCVEGQTKVRNCESNLDKREIQQANKAVEALLGRLSFSEDSPTTLRNGLFLKTPYFFSQNSCAKGMIGGIAASIATKNPISLLIGLSQCLPKANAQQKVGSEFQVNTYVRDGQVHPSVASFSNGNFVVTWYSWGVDPSDVYGQLFNGNGIPIGSEFQINTYTSDSQQDHSVENFANGNFVVTWMSLNQDGSLWGIYGQIFNGTGAKIGGEFQINTYTLSTQENPSVVSFSDDHFVVAWRSDGQDGSGYGIYCQLFERNATKIGSEFQVNTYTPGNQFIQSVASFSNGNFVLSWSSDGQDGSGYGIYSQLFDRNATKIGNEFQVNTYTTGDQGYSSIESFSNGNFVVTWSSDGQDGSGYGIYCQLFDRNTTKIGNEFQVNTYTNSDQILPSVASFPDDHFVVIWESYVQDGEKAGIYGQLFEGNGSKIGNEFRVNTYVTESQENPSVASLSDGNFVVTWESDYQDGDEEGIFGQIFNNSLLSSTISSTTTSSSKSCNFS